MFQELRMDDSWTVKCLLILKSAFLCIVSKGPFQMLVTSRQLTSYEGFGTLIEENTSIDTEAQRDCVWECLINVNVCMFQGNQIERIESSMNM